MMAHDKEKSQRGFEQQGTSGRGTLDDKTIVSDLLLGHKLMCLTYDLAAMESANPGLREAFLKCHSECQHAHEVTFHFMHERGWYPTRSADTDHRMKVESQFGEAGRGLGLQ